MKVFNDYLRDFNLPFPYIDFAILKGVPTNQSSDVENDGLHSDYSDSVIEDDYSGYSSIQQKEEGLIPINKYDRELDENSCSGCLLGYKSEEISPSSSNDFLPSGEVNVSTENKNDDNEKQNDYSLPVNPNGIQIINSTVTGLINSIESPGSDSPNSPQTEVFVTSGEVNVGTENKNDDYDKQNDKPMRVNSDVLEIINSTIPALNNRIEQSGTDASSSLPIEDSVSFGDVNITTENKKDDNDKNNYDSLQLNLDGLKIINSLIKKVEKPGSDPSNSLQVEDSVPSGEVNVANENKNDHNDKKNVYSLPIYPEGLEIINSTLSGLSNRIEESCSDSLYNLAMTDFVPSDKVNVAVENKNADFDKKNDSLPIIPEALEIINSTVPGLINTNEKPGNCEDSTKKDFNRKPEDFVNGKLFDIKLEDNNTFTTEQETQVIADIKEKPPPQEKPVEINLVKVKNAQNTTITLKKKLKVNESNIGLKLQRIEIGENENDSLNSENEINGLPEFYFNTCFQPVYPANKNDEWLKSIEWENENPKDNLLSGAENDNAIMKRKDTSFSTEGGTKYSSTRFSELITDKMKTTPEYNNFDDFIKIRTTVNPVKNIDNSPEVSGIEESKTVRERTVVPLIEKSEISNESILFVEENEYEEDGDCYEKYNDDLQSVKPVLVREGNILKKDFASSKRKEKRTVIAQKRKMKIISKSTVTFETSEDTDNEGDENDKSNKYNEKSNDENDKWSDENDKWNVDMRSVKINFPQKISVPKKNFASSKKGKKRTSIPPKRKMKIWNKSTLTFETPEDTEDEDDNDKSNDDMKPVKRSLLSKINSSVHRLLYSVRKRVTKSVSRKKVCKNQLQNIDNLGGNNGCTTIQNARDPSRRYHYLEQRNQDEVITSVISDSAEGRNMTNIKDTEGCGDIAFANAPLPDALSEPDMENSPPMSATCDGNENPPPEEGTYSTDDASKPREKKKRRKTMKCWMKDNLLPRKQLSSKK